MTARRVTSIALAGVIVLGGGAVWARPQGAPAQGSPLVMKGRAPVSTEVLKLKMPRPAEADLANGLHLMVLEDRRAPQVSFQLLIRGAGGYFDPDALPGLATVTATMMREGTASRTTQQIAQALETMAATVTITSPLSGANATMLGSSLSDNFSQTFALAADILLHPTFPKDELERYRTRTKAGLIQQRAQPGFLASEMFSRVVYGTHPASRASLTPDVLDKLTSESLAEFHRTHFVPDHAVLAIAGDVSMDEARKIVEPMLAEWKKAGTPEPTVTDPPAIGPAKVYFIARPGSVQSSLYVGTQGISRTSPDYDVMSVMNAIIGGGPTGRLFMHLREEKGYTYGAYSNLAAGPFRGNWVASTDVRTEVTEPALKDLIAEVTRMREEPVPAKEFDDTRRRLIASFALSLESSPAVVNLHVTRWLYKLPADYWDKVPERTMAVTQADVQAAAKKYLDPQRLQVVAVGDPTKIAELLKQFGTVESYDTAGKRLGQ